MKRLVSVATLATLSLTVLQALPARAGWVEGPRDFTQTTLYKQGTGDADHSQSGTVWASASLTSSPDVTLGVGIIEGNLKIIYVWEGPGPATLPQIEQTSQASGTVLSVMSNASAQSGAKVEGSVEGTQPGASDGFNAAGSWPHDFTIVSPAEIYVSLYMKAHASASFVGFACSASSTAMVHPL